MNKHIKFIFMNNMELLGHIDKVIYYFRTQNYDTALRRATIVINQLTSNIELILFHITYFNKTTTIFTPESVMDLLQSLLEAQENEDYVLLADLYEIRLSPFLISLQELIISKEEFELDEALYDSNINAIRQKDDQLASDITNLPNQLELFDKGYAIEYTSCGLMTLAIERDGRKYYLHSNNKVLWEAFTLAKSWYSEDKTTYIVYGLGLGYHIKQLIEEDSNIQIEIYESDINIIQLACAFTDLYKILDQTNVKLYHDKDFLQLTKRMNDLDEETEFVLHYPSVRNVENKEIREKFDNYFFQYSSVKNQLRILNGNFHENILHYDGIVDELKNRFEKKDLYIIAAGPSLDHNFMQLKELRQDAIILATGTVFRKLLNAGIKPDYMIITDPNERVYPQIAGLENEQIPLIYLSTAYKGFATNYKGSKYIVFQQGYKKSEEFALKNNCDLYKTGGSVSTTALEIGIHLGCKRIIFLGLDLAFTNNYVHASNTSRRDLSSTEDLKQVEDIHGKMIYTSRVLELYRQWIENRIKDVKGIEFIDATEGGAKIHGMKIAKLSDVLGK